MAVTSTGLDPTTAFGKGRLVFARRDHSASFIQAARGSFAASSESKKRPQLMILSEKHNKYLKPILWDTSKSFCSA